MFKDSGYLPKEKMFSLKFKILIMVVFSFSLAIGDDDFPKPDGEIYTDRVVTEEEKVQSLYERIATFWSGLNDAQQELVNHRTRGDNPRPLLIGKEEYEKIKKGVAQRAAALQAFFVDHFHGNRIYGEANLFPDGFMSYLVDQSGINKDLIPTGVPEFVYGPDLMPSVSGEWLVIEDNTVQPMGLALDGLRPFSVQNELPVLKGIGTEDPELFFKKFVEEVEKNSVGGRPIVGIRYHIPNWLQKLHPGLKSLATNWDQIEQRLKSYGIPMVKISPLSFNGHVLKKGTSYKIKYEKSSGNTFVVEFKDGKKVGRKRIGNVITGVFQHDLRRWAAPGLLKSVKRGKLKLNQTHGIDLLSNKALLPYVEDLIRIYLKEEPILSTAPSRSFFLPNNFRKVDQNFLRTVTENIDRWVIKSTHPFFSAGGFGIVIGKDIKEKPDKIRKLKQLIRRSPENFVAQELIPLDIIYGGTTFDLRPLSYASRGSVIITNRPATRMAGEKVSKLNKTSDSSVRSGIVLLANEASHLTEGARDVTEDEIRENIARVVGREAMRAEQAYTNEVPERWYLKLIRNLRPGFSRTPEIAPEYLPKNERAFELVSFLVPEEELDHLVKGGAEVPEEFLVYKDGKKFIRYLVHPHNSGMIEELNKVYNRDTQRWFGTPTASNRSIWTYSDANPDKVMVIKLSLDAHIAGNHRMIGRPLLQRGVVNTSWIEEAHELSGGNLPDGMKWTYMPEYFSAIPRDAESGGFIARGLPVGLDSSKVDVFPYYAFISEDADIFQQSFRASGIRRKSDFVWQKVLKPAIDLHILLSTKHGLAPEVHGQNVGFYVNNTTKEIQGVFVRDFDPIFPNIEIRKFNKLSTRVAHLLPSWGSEYLQRFHLGRKVLIWSYRYMLFFLVDQYSDFLLNKTDAKALKAFARSYIKDQTNKNLRLRAKGFKNIGTEMDSFQDKHTSERDKIKYQEYMDRRNADKKKWTPADLNPLKRPRTTPFNFSPQNNFDNKGQCINLILKLIP